MLLNYVMYSECYLPFMVHFVSRQAKQIGMQSTSLKELLECSIEGEPLILPLVNLSLCLSVTLMRKIR